MDDPVRRGRPPQKRGAPVRRTAGGGLLLSAVLCALPLFLVPELPEPAQGAPSDSAPGPSQTAQPSGMRDKTRSVTLLQADGAVVELSMYDYLFGVVAAEMPASFAEEALKAQACAARTYTIEKQGGVTKAHPQADVCADSSCCQAYVERAAAEQRWGVSAGTYAAAVESAVAQTDGLGILYEGEPIQAVFFSSAPGYTVDAAEVWGTDVDYLKSVASPEGDEVPNYHSQAVFSDSQVRDAVLDAYPGADLSGDRAGWFDTPAVNAGGTVSSIRVGGVTLTGGQVRALFGLRSA